MNEYRDDKTCYFHPREMVIGICALCLNERLLVLASQREQLQQATNNNTRRTQCFTHRRNPMNLPKIFALSSLFNRLDLRHRKSDDQYSGSPDSQEDSFISIKFEGNIGVASWDKKTTILPKMSLQHCNMAMKQTSSNGGDDGVKAVIEHSKAPRGSLRWRKRIGEIFQVIKWKKTKKGNVRHVGTKLEGSVKMRHGWIRSLTKGRAKE